MGAVSASGVGRADASGPPGAGAAWDPPDDGAAAGVACTDPPPASSAAGAGAGCGAGCGVGAAAPPRPSSWRARAAWSNATTRSKAVGTTACEDAKPCWPRRIAKPITPKISHTARPSSMEVRICPGPASGASR
ncbi:hypothetical protein AUV02_10140 [Micrococcus sp. CH3]|nr:hypothetical protein AUV02_10140 [Micrococcus sp. CH3]